MVTLSSDAERLLVTAANANGRISTSQALVVFRVEAGGVVFFEGRDGSERDHWKAVIDELWNSDLIDPRNYKCELWEVTTHGYVVAGRIQAR